MKNNYKSLVLAAFLVVAGLFSRGWNSPQLSTLEVKSAHYSAGLLEVAQAQAQENETADAAVLVQGGNLAATQPTISAPAASIVYAATAVQDSGQPIGQATDPSQDSQYTVKKGDTFSGVAAHFNISVTTILSANPNISKKTLKVGEVLTIPGVSSGANGTNSSSGPALPDFNSDFILPAQGYNHGVLDSNNGINIINSCGTPVVAAADGVVVPDNNISDTLGGWNGGYGNFVLIEQPFGNDIFTRYAHLSQSLIQIGDYVKQGQEIGLIGQTGGASVCELDFEVIGARNPFAK